jgi:hypothetical protein
MVQRCRKDTYEQGRIGEEREGKETDRCPLTGGGQSEVVAG